MAALMKARGIGPVMLPTWQWGGAALLLVAVVVGVALLAGESSDTVASPGEAPPVQSPATQVPAAASVAMPEAATEASSNPGEEPVDPEPQPAPQGLSQRAAAGDAALWGAAHDEDLHA